jgi:hypothetical protein
MSRELIRTLKKSVRAGAIQGAPGEDIRAAREAALALLRRSIALKHDRLALRRLACALELGVEVNVADSEYCKTTAARLHVSI